MTLDYTKVWNALNELESISSKICSAREILDSAIVALENHKKNKAEALIYAADEYLQYYLQEFDSKFKDAWNETITKLHQSDYYGEYSGSTVSNVQYTDEELNAMCAAAEKQEKQRKMTYDEAIAAGYEMTADGFWIPPQKEDKVVKWHLPIDEIGNGDTGEQEYFITFPDDLLEAANLNPGDEVEWVDKNDGTFILRKVTKPLGGDEC